MKSYSEPLIPETRENRLLAHVIRQARPPRRLQLHKKVTAASTWWKIIHFGCIDRPSGCIFDAVVWQCHSVRTHKSRKMPPSFQKSTCTIKCRHQTIPQSRSGSIARKNSNGVSIQLLIFPSHDIMWAAGVPLRRFERQQEASFVGLLAICSNFLDSGRCHNEMMRNSSWKTTDRRWISLNPDKLYTLENGSECMDCAVCAGDPLHSHTMTNKTKSSTTCWTSPPRCHNRHRYNKLHQIDDSEASNRRVYIYILKFDGVCLWFRTIVWPNYVVL